MLTWLRDRWSEGPGSRMFLVALGAFLALLALTAALSLAYGPDRVQAAVCGRAGCWVG